MNIQNPGIEWTNVFGPGTGRTWNVIGGCGHECRWEMPDGKIAKCYAEDVAERLAQKAYPYGFAHHYWRPEKLQEPLREAKPCGIFLDSMSDVMGAWVPDEQIEMVLDVCRQTPQHVYFLLTKNAPRLLKFKFPPNVWVGASMPPDYMHGKQLTGEQKIKMLERALAVLGAVDANIVWMSFEPLSWDVSSIVRKTRVSLDWAVIGAASNGPKRYQPEPEHVRRLLTTLAGYGTRVFFKGNLRGSVAADPWREEFPADGER